MKHIINPHGELLIYNDLGKQIFGVNKHNQWFKWDYDQNSKTIYYEDSGANIINYDDEIYCKWI